MKKEYIRDEMSGLEYVPLSLDDTFAFDCVRCGKCCNNVEAAIPLESLDLFRLAKHLGTDPGDFTLEYADMYMLTEGFPQLFMKTQQGQCVFLKDNLCSIREARPRTCRMYPLSAGPGNSSALEYLWVTMEHHQYAPGQFRVGGWMDETLSHEDREYLRLEHGYTLELSRFLKAAVRRNSESVLRAMLIHRYFNYDTGEDFLPQYEENMTMLLDALKWMGEHI